jgi:DNA replication initiation complex subunit (GINS family)
MNIEGLTPEEKELARQLWDMLNDNRRGEENARAMRAAPERVCDAIDEATMQMGMRNEMCPNPFNS